MSKMRKTNRNIAMTERQQAEHMAAQWIVRRSNGPWTEPDTADLDAWLAKSASHRVAYYRLNSAWQETGRLSALVGRTGATLQAAGAGGSASAPALPRRPRVSLLTAAASLLLIVGPALLWFWLGEARHDYSTIVGGLQAIPMPDGSKVILNTDSEVRVAVSDIERRVELKQGEAFFEVAKDPQRPFVVSVANQRIIAVGTAFSVRRQGRDVRVLVSEGAVRVEVPGKEAQLLKPLPAGSVIRTQSNEILVQTKPVAEIEQSLSWRNGLLTFRNTPLADAVAEFNRYNTRKIVIADPAIKAIAIGGIFRATNLDPFVNLLEEGFPVHATEENGKIMLKSIGGTPADARLLK